MRQVEKATRQPRGAEPRRGSDEVVLSLLYYYISLRYLLLRADSPIDIIFTGLIDLAGQNSN